MTPIRTLTDFYRNLAAVPEPDVPVSSEADWQTTVVAPIRQELERLGVVVEGLTDDQLVEVSYRVSEQFGGEMPDVQALAIITDAVRFEAKLSEDER